MSFETAARYRDALGRDMPRRRLRGLPDAERFRLIGWTVTDANCWRWNGYISPRGYGRFCNSNGQLAHRFALEQKLGRPLGDGMESLHECNNKFCVNPDHLREGTHTENIRQAARDRLLPQTKMTEAEVQQIRRWAADGLGPAEIARKMGVSRETVSAIVNGKNWKWLENKEDN